MSDEAAMLRFWVFVCIFVGLVGCRDTLEPLPLSVTLTTDRAVVAAGDSVTFNIDAQGGNLSGIVVNYGDGEDETVTTSGARTARIRLRHAYQQRGQFTASAAASDVAQGQKVATVSVQVQ